MYVISDKPHIILIGNSDKPHIILIGKEWKKNVKSPVDLWLSMPTIRPLNLGIKILRRQQHFNNKISNSD